MRNNLLGLSPLLDDAIHKFGHLAWRYRDFHPANAGDVSLLLPIELGDQLLDQYNKTASPWINIRDLDALAGFRRDGRIGYRSEGISDLNCLALLKAISGRILLVTRTGAAIPELQFTVSRGEDGKLFNLVEVDNAAENIRLLYGNHQYGSIPSIELHVHLLGAALGTQDGLPSPATVHCHPYSLIALGRHPKIGGDFRRFNAAIYTQIEGLLRNYEDLIGVVDYFVSGSERLLVNTLPVLKIHPLVLWMNHGFVTREASIERAYILISYADDAARAALDGLNVGSLGLPEWAVDSFLRAKGL